MPRRIHSTSFITLSSPNNRFNKSNLSRAVIMAPCSRTQLLSEGPYKTLDFLYELYESREISVP
jgi:hypothetical protein